MNEIKQGLGIMITPYEKNGKKHPNKQLKQIAGSLSRFGWRQPIVVNSSGVIIVGHGRYLAYQDYKDKFDIKDPWIQNDKGETISGSPETDPMTLGEEKSYRLADNKLNESDWDMELVIEDLKELDTDLLELTGFDQDLIIESDEKYDEIPDTPDEPKAKLGDIYQLGNHRIMCGDSTKIEDVEKLMEGKKATLAFNDPPYGMKKEKDGVKNDNLNYENLLKFNKEWINLQWTYLTDNGSWYCWGTDEPLMDIYNFIIKPLVQEQKATFRNLLTWDKLHGQGQLAEDFRMYPTADEKCLFVMCGVQGFNNNSDNYYEGWEPIREYLLKSRLEMGWSVKDMKKIVGHSENGSDHWTNKSQFEMPTREVYDDMKAEADRLRNQTNNQAFRKDYDELKKDYDELKKTWYETRSYFNNTHDNQNNIWHFPRVVGKERQGHATPKPIELCSRAINSSCPKNEIVMDLFLGSGSTLIACEKTNRICYGMELDPKYIDVIIRRWQEYTGGNAVRLNDDKIWDEIS